MKLDSISDKKPQPPKSPKIEKKSMRSAMTGILFSPRRGFTHQKTEINHSGPEPPPKNLKTPIPPITDHSHRISNISTQIKPQRKKIVSLSPTRLTSPNMPSRFSFQESLGHLEEDGS